MLHLNMFALAVAHGRRNKLRTASLEFDGFPVQFMYFLFQSWTNGHIFNHIPVTGAILTGLG